MNSRLRPLSRLIIYSALFLASNDSHAAVPLTISNASFETATLSINGGTGPFFNVFAGSTLGVGGTLANWTASATTIPCKSPSPQARNSDHDR
jgi:hypothetical protein